MEASTRMLLLGINNDSDAALSVSKLTIQPFLGVS